MRKNLLSFRQLLGAILFKSACIAFTFSMFIAVAQAQVTTNGGSGLAATYPSLDAAIIALNSATINAPVVITLTGSETAPSAGYVITASGTTTNTITLIGDGNTVTAGTGYTAGSYTDGIFKLVGSDWITIQDFVMQENAANTDVGTTTNTATEWGIALLYATTTNGAKNCTIQNNTITMSATYPNSFGIYSNSSHSASVVTTAATATGADGGNHGLKIYGNTINNAKRPIVVVGPTADADFLTGVDIGGSSAATGNMINNFGGPGTITFYNVTTSGVGIYLRSCKGASINYNSITSSDGLTAYSADLYGVLVASATTPTGSYTTSISNNILDLRSGAVANGVYGIYVVASAFSSASTLNLNCNTFSRFTQSLSSPAPSGTHTIIFTGCTALQTTINGNVFDNLTVIPSTTFFTFISANYVIPSGGSKIVNNNSIKTGFSRTGAGGSVRLYYDVAANAIGTTQENRNNNFSNITLSFSNPSYSMNGWHNLSGGTKTLMGNTFKGWTITGGPINGITCAAAAGSTASTLLSGNTVSNIEGTMAVTGIYFGGATGTETATIRGNTVHTLKLTSSPSTIIAGLQITNSGITSALVEKNTIYNIEYVNTGPSGGPVKGLVVGNGTDITVQNNLIGDLRAPAHTVFLTPSIMGIDVGGAAGSTRKLYHNTVYLNATTSGTNFFTTALHSSVAGSLILRNNILVNLSTAVGTGNSSAFQYSTSGGLSTYDATSNNNLFYAGTPSAANIIYYDGTNADQTLTAFRTRLADSRDANSITLNPTFLSTTPGHVNYLHIDPTVTSAINAGAVAISGLTDDYDGNIRAGTPDIGADEYTPAGTACTPPTPVISASGSLILCNCNSVALTASGGTSYRWNTGETTASLAVSSPGTYTVTATNASGCQATTSETVTLTASAPIVTTASSCTSYTWSENGQTYSQSGSYMVVSGCVTKLLKLTVTSTCASLPLTWLQLSGSVLEGGKSRINWRVAESNVASYTIEKSMDGARFSVAGFINSKGDGTHDYSYTDNVSVSANTWYRIKQADHDGKFSYSPVLALKPTRKESGTKLFPNPVADYLNVMVEKNHLGSIATIVNGQGKTENTIRITSESFVIDFSNFPAGIYYIRIGDNAPVPFAKFNQ